MLKVKHYFFLIILISNLVFAEQQIPSCPKTGVKENCIEIRKLFNGIERIREFKDQDIYKDNYTRGDFPHAKIITSKDFRYVSIANASLPVNNKSELTSSDQTNKLDSIKRSNNPIYFCPIQAAPQMPIKAIRDSLQGTVTAKIIVSEGEAKEVEILSGPSIFRDNVAEAIMAFKCVLTDDEFNFQQTFNFKIE